MSSTVRHLFSGSLHSASWLFNGQEGVATGATQRGSILWKNSRDVQELFYQAWWFIRQHPEFMFKNEREVFPFGLYIDVVKVNPDTDSIDDDASKNTKVQIWLEHGPYHPAEDEMPEGFSHDIELDCGGDTFEEVVIELARLIKENYGTYPEQDS